MHYFLSEHAWILNRNTGRKVKWQPWPYQLDLLDIFLDFDDIVLLKARQLGWSWLLTGYADWKAIFMDGAKGLFLSQGEKEAYDLIDKAKYIINNLPHYLSPIQRHPDSREVIDFKTHQSKLETLPSTDKSGRSTDATFVIRDELSNHPYGEANFKAIGPTIDAGGQLIDCSTINKDDAESHFTDRVLRAQRGATRKDLPSGLTVYTGGESGAVLVFGGWRLRPVRQEGLDIDEWFELRVRPKYTSAAIEQEYPATIEEALKQPETSAFFSVRATEDMLLQEQEPLKASPIDTRNGIVKIYKLPVVGGKYIVYTDPSDGSEDPFHTVVMDARTFEGVAEAGGFLKADECAWVHDDLVRAYGRAFNSFEANGFSGGKFTETIKSLGTPSVATRRNATGRLVEGQIGWWATGDGKRTSLLGLEEAVRKRLIITHLRETVLQFKSCIKKDGEITMVKGVHDDAIAAWAGAWATRKYAPVGDMKVTSWESA